MTTLFGASSGHVLVIVVAKDQLVEASEFSLPLSNVVSRLRVPQAPSPSPTRDMYGLVDIRSNTRILLWFRLLLYIKLSCICKNKTYITGQT